MFELRGCWGTPVSIPELYLVFLKKLVEHMIQLPVHKVIGHLLNFLNESVLLNESNDSMTHSLR